MFLKGSRRPGTEIRKTSGEFFFLTVGLLSFYLIVGTELLSWSDFEIVGCADDFARFLQSVFDLAGCE